MATTVSIHLNSLTLTPSSSAPVTSSRSAQTPLSPNRISPSTTVAPSTAQPPTHPPQTATNISQQPLTSFYSLGMPKKILTCIAQILTAIAGLFAAYIALSLAAWTLVKDFRDDCRSQNNTYGFISPECRTALRKVLRPSPLGFGSFLHGLWGDKFKRTLLEGMNGFTPSKPFSSTPSPTAVNKFLLVGFACVLTINLVQSAYIIRLLRWRSRHSEQIEQIQMPITWVPNSVCRPIASPVTTALENAPQPTTLRKRFTAPSIANGNEDRTKGDWEPSGRSVMDAADDGADSELGGDLLQQRPLRTLDLDHGDIFLADDPDLLSHALDMASFDERTPEPETEAIARITTKLEKLVAAVKHSRQGVQLLAEQIGAS